MHGNLLIGLTGIVILGIGAHWLAWRFKLPSILLLLLFGFLAGPVFGFLHPDEMLGELLFPFVSLSVAIILFEGGLTLRYSELPAIGSVVLKLVTIGVIVTWTITAVTAYFIFNFSISLSVLLGAILVVTGPTVIGPLLQQVRPKGKVSSALKWEGILIDPVGAILAVIVFEAILEQAFQHAPLLVLRGVLVTIVIGLVLGVAGASLMVLLLRRFLVPDHLQNGVALLILVTTFTLSDILQPEAGLLTATVMGVALANQKFVTVKHIVEFKENLRVLLIATLFILLSARLEMQELTQLGLGAFLFVAMLIFVTRPLAVFASSIGTNLNIKERLFLSWMAPRGIVAAAVSSIFALALVDAGHAEAEKLVPITFFVIVSTVLLYGLTAKPIAGWLGVAEENPQGLLIMGAHPFARQLAKTLQTEGYTVKLIDSNWRNLSEARMEGLSTYYGNALAEYVLDEINLDGIGRFLALTSNDEANSLAALHFAEVFDRSNIYQLPIIKESNGSERDFSPPHLRGRILFSQEQTYRQLNQAWQKGATIRKTELTKTFNYRDFQEYYAGRAQPLFLITTNGNLAIFTANEDLSPKPGQTLISLVMPEATDKTARAAKQMQSEAVPATRAAS